jgi:hypothetical protein
MPRLPRDFAERALSIQRAVLTWDPYPPDGITIESTFGISSMRKTLLVSKFSCSIRPSLTVPTEGLKVRIRRTGDLPLDQHGVHGEFQRNPL